MIDDVQLFKTSSRFAIVFVANLRVRIRCVIIMVVNALGRVAIGACLIVRFACKINETSVAHSHWFGAYIYNQIVVLRTRTTYNLATVATMMLKGHKGINDTRAIECKAIVTFRLRTVKVVLWQCIHTSEFLSGTQTAACLETG